MPWRADLPRGAWLPPALAAAARLAVLAVNPAPPERFEYDELARSLLAGDGYVQEYNGTAYRGYSNGLLYTALTSACYAFGAAGVPLLRTAQLLIAAATVLVVVLLAARLGAARRALAAGALVALHPALVYYDVRKLHPLGLDALLPAMFVALVLASKRGSAWTCAGSGLVLGAAMLERLTLAPMLIAGAFWIADGLPPRDRLRRVGLFLGAAAAALAPWLARNQVVFGAPILSTMTAEYFFIGNVPPSLGSCRLPSGVRVLDAAPQVLRDRLSASDELGQVRLFRQASTDFVAREPKRFAAGVGRKLLYFWTWAPQTGVLYPARYRRIYLALYVALAVAAVAGAGRLGRASADGRRAVGLIAALCATVSAVHALLYFEMRHRWALEPLMVLLAVFAWPSISGAQAPAAAARSAGTDRRSDGGALR